MATAPLASATGSRFGLSQTGSRRGHPKQKQPLSSSQSFRPAAPVPKQPQDSSQSWATYSRYTRRFRARPLASSQPLRPAASEPKQPQDPACCRSPNSIGNFYRRPSGSSSSSSSIAAVLRPGAAETHVEPAGVQRWFENKLEDYHEGQGPLETNTPEVQRALQDAAEQVLRARHGGDPTVYVGSSGVAYMLWHCCTVARPVGVRVTNNWLERGLRYTRAAVQDVQRFSKDQIGVSLMCGHAGVLCVAALMAHTASQARSAQGKQREAEQLRTEAAGYLRQYNGLLSIAVSSQCFADEVLYGRAGYLYGCLLLNQQLGAESVPHQSVQYVIDALLRSGRRQAAKLHDPAIPLHYTWPERRGGGGGGREQRGVPYLGMAHGLMGILHVLLLVRDKLQRSTRIELDTMLEFVLEQERHEDGSPGPGGHYPTVLGEAPQAQVPLVHWCHGATGAAMLFARAYQETRRQEYLAAALRAGEAVWTRGLLHKGPGLCHGVAGSAYAQMALHRATGGDPKHLFRALQMARFSRTPEFAECARTPDRPFSLFEGLAGAACLWADLLQPQRSAFPLVELRDREGWKPSGSAGSAEVAAAMAAAATAAMAASAAAINAAPAPGNAAPAAEGVSEARQLKEEGEKEVNSSGNEGSPGGDSGSSASSGDGAVAGQGE